MNLDEIQTCSYLLPDPGGEVVRECLNELRKAKQFISRVLCGSDWTKQELKELAEDLNIKLEGF